MQFTKKASLNLSINAIVILILAITMLGLGLAFMRNIFSTAGEQITAISANVEKQMIDQMKAGTKIIDINQPRLEMDKGQSASVVLGFQNVGDKAMNFQINSIEASELGLAIDVESTKCGSAQATDLQIRYMAAATKVASGGDVRVVPFNLKTIASAAAPFTCFFVINVCEYEGDACDVTTDRIHSVELTVDVIN
jgi:hypothetical protein